MLPAPQRARPSPLGAAPPLPPQPRGVAIRLGLHPRLPSRAWEAYIMHHGPSLLHHLSIPNATFLCQPIASSILSFLISLLTCGSVLWKFHSITMALAMNVRTQVVAAPVVASVPSLRQANTGTSVRFNNGAVAFKRASLMVVRAEKTEPGPGGRENTSGAPTTPLGMSGSEAPLGVVTQSAPLEQGSKVPVSERMAYICQDCGYVYDDEKPFEDVEEDYSCPQCTAPKARFMLANASVGEVLDTTKEDPQN